MRTRLSQLSHEVAESIDTLGAQSPPPVLVGLFVLLTACRHAEAPADVVSAPSATTPFPRAPAAEAPRVSDASAAMDASDASTSGRTRAEDRGAPNERVPEGMLLVPGGTFTMGADKGGEEDEHPAHAVTLDAFFLDQTEVTNEAYETCVRDKACRPRDAFVAKKGNAGTDAMFNGPRQPVVGVSWDDARAYCAHQGKRLPREAEFERAIRGDDGRRFPWGQDAPSADRTVFGRVLGHGHTDDVGAHPSGKGPYGHDDLAGNVWEWMEDMYDPYAYRRATAARGVPGSCEEILATQDELRSEGRQGFTGSNPIPNECERVLRGGAFNYDGPGLRSTNRVHHPGRFRLVMTGFRCAKDAKS